MLQHNAHSNTCTIISVHGEYICIHAAACYTITRASTIKQNAKHTHTHTHARTHTRTHTHQHISFKVKAPSVQLRGESSCLNIHPSLNDFTTLVMRLGVVPFSLLYTYIGGNKGDRERGRERERERERKREREMKWIEAFGCRVSQLTLNSNDKGEPRDEANPVPQVLISTCTHTYTYTHIHMYVACKTQADACSKSYIHV